jgi:hypothetical protein
MLTKTHYADRGCGNLRLCGPSASTSCPSSSTPSAPVETMVMRPISVKRHASGFPRFILHELGSIGQPLVLLHRLFIRPFLAPSFPVFWRDWNPAYRYFMALYLYRPLRRWCSRRLAVFLTFIGGGLLVHDLPFFAGYHWFRGEFALPTGAILFSTIGLLTLLNERIGLDLSPLSSHHSSHSKRWMDCSEYWTMPIGYRFVAMGKAQVHSLRKPDIRQCGEAKRPISQSLGPEAGSSPSRRPASCPVAGCETDYAIDFDFGLDRAAGMPAGIVPAFPSIGISVRRRTAHSEKST